MSKNDQQHIQEHIKIYLNVFFALAILTVITVAVSYIELSPAEGIMLALAIASVKASLVAGYFMHLISQKQTIIWVLILTFIFFLILMFIPLITVTDSTGLY